MKRLYLLLMLMALPALFCHGSGNEIKTTPLTTNAEAVKLYSYLYQQYGNKAISSVMAEWNWNHKVADQIYEAVGKYPAMNCYDFIHIFVPSGNGWINYSDITPVTEWTEAGGIVSLMWHFMVPKSETINQVRPPTGLLMCLQRVHGKTSGSIRRWKRWQMSS